MGWGEAMVSGVGEGMGVMETRGDGMGEAMVSKMRRWDKGGWDGGGGTRGDGMGWGEAMVSGVGEGMGVMEQGGGMGEAMVSGMRRGDKGGWDGGRQW